MSVTIPTYQHHVDYDTVLAVQKKLKEKGFDPGPLDGKLGPKTAAAIKASGASSEGVIDYGTLLKLGVPAPGAQSAADRARAEAERKAAIEKAKKQVKEAEVKVATAPSVPAQEQAKVELAQAEVTLQNLEPGILDRPWWHLAIAGMGVFSIGVGLFTLVKGKKR